MATNCLFVDYFNAFLLNPQLGAEKVRFNFVTGDLELIEPDRNDDPTDKDLVSRIRSASGRVIFSSTAESVKFRLESQLRTILKNTSNPVSESTSRPKTGPITTKSAKLNPNAIFEQIKKFEFSTNLEKSIT